MGSWRFFSVAPEVSGPLSFWGFGVVAGSFVFSLMFPPWALSRMGLVVSALGCGVLAVRGAPGKRLLLWWLSGFCLAGTQTLGGAWVLAEGRVPVRFVGTVRDGFQLGETGWQTRVRLLELEGADCRWREVRLVVGGSANPYNLPAPGSRVEGAGELERGRRLGAPVMLWVKSPLLLKAAPPRGVDHFRERTRQKLGEAAGYSVKRQRAAALAAALGLGRREGLGEAETASLRDAGLNHILAVSGLHVGLVVGTLWLVLLAFGVAPKARRWALIPAALLFALLAGGGMPVRRATLATLVVLLARSLGRPLELLPVLWAVVGILALWEPGAVWEPGFQLSAGVALALVRWVPGLIGRLGGGKFASAVAVAMAAQLASSPLLGMHFGAVPALAMPLNLLAVPLAAVLVVLSLGACLWVWILPGGAGWWLDALGAVSWVMSAVASFGESSALAFPHWSTLLVVMFAVLFLGAWLPWGGASVSFGGVILLTITSLAWPYLPSAPGPRLVMLPVRQGMALWVAGQQGSLLVDTGRGAREVSQSLAMYRGAGRLGALVLTHPDADHMGGALFVLKVLRPPRVFLPGALANRSEFLPVRWQALRQQVPVVALWPGQRMRVGDVVCDVLWPNAGQNLEDNDASLVLRCTLAEVSLVLVGDLGKAGEHALLAQKEALKASILQVGHHGSRTSSTLPFLLAVSPRLALVPTGTSPRFPFPHPEVMQRLRTVRSLALVQNRGFQAIRLHPDGLVEVESAKVYFRVSP